MIYGVVIVNSEGRPRLVRLNSHQNCNEVAKRIHEKVSKLSLCNIVSSADLFPSSRLIYRIYQSLFITFIVDEKENELAILDLITVSFSIIKGPYRMLEADCKRREGVYGELCQDLCDSE